MDTKYIRNVGNKTKCHHKPVRTDRCFSVRCCGHLGEKGKVDEFAYKSPMGMLKKESKFI